MSRSQLHAGANIQHDQPLLLAVGNFGFHVFTSGLIVAWIALVACTLVILERAVKMSTERTSIPWMYRTDGLPSILVTMVAQGHVAVTTMYITRLALSGLQVPFGTPRSWAEMFWLADAKWGGPVGIIEAVLAAIPLRIRRVSKAFLLFCTVSMAAFTLPLVLQSAYPVATVDVRVKENYDPYTLTESALPMIDVDEQIGSGGGAWATGQSVLELYNKTIYHQAGQPRGNGTGGDLFFAGDIQGRDMTLPGLRVQCNCINRADFDHPSLLLIAVDAGTVFGELCNSEIGVMKSQDTFTILGMNMSWCTNIDIFMVDPMQAFPAKNTSTLLWYNTSYETGQDYSKVVNIRSVVTHCTVATFFGKAQLYGRNMTYESFERNDTILGLRPGARAGDYASTDPITAILLSLGIGNDINSVVRTTIAGQLGIVEVVNGASTPPPPTADQFAERMRDGVLHMAAALMVLSRTRDITYPCINHYSVSGFTRNSAMATGVIALLVVWLAGLLLATVMLLRPTFSDALDSHVAARLLLHRPDLVEGIPMAPHEKNKKLAEEFSGVHLNRSEGKFEPIEMDEAGVGNYAEMHSVETQGGH